MFIVAPLRIDAHCWQVNDEDHIAKITYFILAKSQSHMCAKNVWFVINDCHVMVIELK